MTTNPEHYAQRSFSVRIEDVDEKGRHVHGVVVPYDTATRVDDGFGPYVEAFAPGAFARSIEQRGAKIRLKAMHNRELFPIGQATEWDDSSEALRGSFRVSDTSLGRDALTLVSDGVVEAFSVGFRGITAEERPGIDVYRTEAAISEVSLVDSPAYKDAAVEGVRALSGIDDPDELAAAWLALPDTVRAALAAQTAPADPGTGTPDLGDTVTVDPIPYAAIAARILTL